MKRRAFLKATLTVSGAGAIYLAIRHFIGSGPVLPSHRLTTFIKPYAIWSETDFDLFLLNLDKEQEQLVLSSLNIEHKSFSPAKIKERLVWLSSNIATYPFRNKTAVDYSDLTRWVAKQHDDNNTLSPTASTFEVEKFIFESLFVGMWDKLNFDNRMKLMERIDEDNILTNRAALAALSGSAALASLSATVYFSGFAFYSTMSVVICSVAGFFGVALPFTAYTGASAIAAVLSGPVGWILLAIGAVAGGLLLGAPNASKLIPFICQMHMIKVDVLRQQGQLDSVLQILSIKK